MRKILVMEDEDNIRAFVVLNLKRVGYDVVDVASGEEMCIRDRNSGSISIESSHQGAKLNWNQA